MNIDSSETHFYLFIVHFIHQSKAEMNHFLSVVAALFLVGLSHSFVVNQFSSNYYKNIFIKNGYTKQSDGTWNSYKQSLDHWNNSNSEQFDQVVICDNKNETY